MQSETGTNYYKEIPLSEILAVNTSRSATSAAVAARAVEGAGIGWSAVCLLSTQLFVYFLSLTLPPPAAEASSSSSHCFEIRTANVDFYVGDLSASGAQAKRDSGTGPEVGP